MKLYALMHADGEIARFLDGPLIFGSTGRASVELEQIKNAFVGYEDVSVQAIEVVIINKEA